MQDEDFAMSRNCFRRSEDDGSVLYLSLVPSDAQVGLRTMAQFPIHLWSPLMPKWACLGLAAHLIVPLMSIHRVVLPQPHPYCLIASS